MTRLPKQVLTAGAVGLVLCSIAGCGAERYKAKTEGSAPYIEKVKKGEPFYNPPANALPPGLRMRNQMRMRGGMPGSPGSAGMPGAPRGGAQPGR